MYQTLYDNPKGSFGLEAQKNFSLFLKKLIKIKFMEIKEIVELVLKSSNSNPYTGMLSKKDNLIAAIDLAKLAKNFADEGHKAEAMNIDSEQWSKVISELESMSLNLS